MKNGYTLLGVLAILFWSSTIGFSRTLTEQLGALTAGFVIHTAAGIFGLAVTAWHRPNGGIRTVLHLPRRYLFICGALMCAYIVLLYLALGLAQNHFQVIVVGLINYLWPALTLLFSLPILGNRANGWLPVGSLIAIAGVGAASFGGGEFSLGDLGGARLPYLLVMGAAVCWSLYTNLAKHWLGEGDANGVAVFLLASGLVLGLLRLFFPETSVWSLPTLGRLVYVILCPALLAYTFWDLGTRKGKLVFLAALSYLTPLLSTLISVWVLDEPASPRLWLAGGMIVAGAAVSQAGIRQPPVSSPPAEV
jgi:drug/metabolite transporter (DMT)-like permease